jgi:3-methyladenine DNA glycosylase AlkD
VTQQTTTRVDDVLERIRSLGNPENVVGMARFGIDVANTYGIAAPVLQKLSREIGKEHDLALALWESGIHEARKLAPLIDVPKLVTEDQMESWVADFNSWDICDDCCSNLFDKTPFAYEKAVEWSRREEEYVKRAAFVLMAVLAVHDKKASDERFIEFLPIIASESGDDRNFVRKAVNWALRQIGKRSRYLNQAAIETAHKVRATNTRAGRWIGADALRELTGEAVQKRLKR